MEKVKLKIAEQIGSHGIYGEIEMYCSVSNDTSIVEFAKDIESEAKKWNSAIEFGMAYFLDNSACKAAHIKVEKIHDNEVDTNQVVIAYLVAKALSTALNIKMKREPYFDRDAIAFVFPK